jgi:hypothetical protein
MNTPGFTAEASLYRRQNAYSERDQMPAFSSNGINQAFSRFTNCTRDDDGERVCYACWDRVTGRLVTKCFVY